MWLISRWGSELVKNPFFFFFPFCTFALPYIGGHCWWNKEESPDATAWKHHILSLIQSWLSEPPPTTSPPSSSDALISQVALQLDNCKCGAQSLLVRCQHSYWRRCSSKIKWLSFKKRAIWPSLGCGCDAWCYSILQSWGEKQETHRKVIQSPDSVYVLNLLSLKHFSLDVLSYEK